MSNRWLACLVLVASLGIVREAEANISVTNPPSVSFGEVRVDAGQTAGVPVTVKNNDTGASVMVTATLTGADAGDFAIIAPATQTIGMNGAKNFSVAFNPMSPGVKSATLSFSDGAGGASIPINGTGTVAVLTTADAAVTTPNTVSVTANSVVKNEAGGPGTLNISALTLTQSSGWFKLAACGTTNCTVNIPLAPGATSNVGVVCTPPSGAAAQTQTATLTVTSDSDAGGRDNTATISCTSQPPVAAAMLDPLGNANLGSSSTTTLTVTNSGPAGTNTLTYNAAIGGPDMGNFTFENGCFMNCGVNGANGMRTVMIRFTPNAPRVFNATLTVTTDDPAHASFMFALTATGNGPLVTFNPTSLAFSADVNIAATPQAVTVRNMGNQSLTLNNVSVSDTTNYILTQPSSTTVLPGDSVNVMITCKPTTRGDHPATLQIDNSAANNPSQAIGLTCTGLQGEISASPPSFDFAGVSISTSAMQVFQITNVGNTPVRGISAMLTSATTGFTLDAPVTTTISGGTSTTVTLHFSPTVMTDGGTATVAVKGTWGNGGNSVMITTSFTATAQALSTGFTVSMQPDGNFGAHPFTTADPTPPLRTLCVLQTGGTQIDLHGIDPSFAPDSGALGELDFSNPRTSLTGCDGVATASADPRTGTVTLNRMGSAFLMDVKWTNHNRVGALDAQIKVSTSNMQGARQVQVTGTSTSGVLMVSDATYDFGAVDTQGVVASKTITLKNTGDADMTLSGFTPTVGASYTAFTPANALTLSPNAEMTFKVDYDPSVASPVGSEEPFSVTFAVGGIFIGATPPVTTVTFQGRGIDRTISVDGTPVFANTYRNPGSAAPMADVTIRNQGEAPLHISMLMLGDSSWQLKDPTMQDFSIPGNGLQIVTLLFTPTKVGLNTGELIITDDDAPNDMAPYVSTLKVDLSGVAETRDVMFTGGPINLGYTGTNFPVVRGDAIQIKNMDTGHPFTISRLEIQGAGGAIKIMGETENITLAPQELRTFDVQFAPGVGGDYNATVVMYLDEDQTPHSTQDILGKAVFVEAEGGGGCSVGGDGRGAGASGLLALGILGLVRRRRRRSSALTAALLVAGGSVASADDLTLSAFTPTPETKPSNFQVQSGEVGENGAWVASAVMSVATDPLLHVATGSDGTPQQQDVISRSMGLTIGGAYAFLERWEVGAHMPLYSQAGDGKTMGADFGTDAVSGSARGDLVLHGKFKLLRKPLEGKGYAAVAANLQLTLPTATDGAFTGVKYPTARAQALATLMPGAFSHRLTLSANAGFLLQTTSEYANLEQKSGIVGGLGLQFRALDKVWADGEVYGTFMPSSKTDAMGTTVALSPIEWLVGVKIKPDHRFTIGIAGGRGLTSAVGTPAIRAVLSLTVTPKAEKLGPIHPPPPPKPDLDEDNDGLKASIDKCDNEPEDKDGFEDQDGCPDLDNDGDGVADAVDKCLNEPEDLDKFEDLDGCPDLDNDKDGVPDTADKCPLVAEDKDAFEDTDGCPEGDNDKDGIADEKDKCPNQPETVNGNKDDDGCPDKGQSLVAVSTDRLDTLESIQFSGHDSSKLSSKSNNILEQVAGTLRAHPEVAKLRVTCHVNPTNNPAKDQSLSDDRAAAVRDWLVNWGIAAGRIDTRGFGGTKPLAKPGTKNAASINDRVELIILERN